MAISVVKNSGEKEDFTRQKVVESCVKTGAPKDLAEKIAGEVKDSIEDETSTKEIRDMVLQKLGEVRQQWVDDWKEYEKQK